MAATGCSLVGAASVAAACVWHCSGTAHDVKQVKEDVHDVKVEVKELRSEVKADINKLRSDVKADIKELRSEVKADIKELHAKLDALAVMFTASSAKQNLLSMISSASCALIVYHMFASKVWHTSCVMHAGRSVGL